MMLQSFDTTLQTIVISHQDLLRLSLRCRNQARVSALICFSQRQLSSIRMSHTPAQTSITINRWSLTLPAFTSLLCDSSALISLQISKAFLMFKTFLTHLKICLFLSFLPFKSKEMAAAKGLCSEGQQTMTIRGRVLKSDLHGAPCCPPHP